MQILDDRGHVKLQGEVLYAGINVTRGGDVCCHSVW